MKQLGIIILSILFLTGCSNAIQLRIVSYHIANSFDAKALKTFEKKPELMNLHFGSGNKTKTAMMVAIQKDNKIVFDYLLRKGVDFHNPIGATRIIPAFIAAEQEQSYFLQMMVRYGLDVLIENERGESLLYHAIVSDSYDCVSFLAAHPVVLEHLKNRSDSFAPMFAGVHNGNQVILRKLVDLGYNVNPEDEQGFTPIEILYRDKDIDYYFDDITKYMIEHSDLQLYGRSIAIRTIEEDWRSGGFLMSSRFFGYDLINEIDPNGNTALEVLLKHKKYSSARGLLFMGLKTDNLKSKGHTIGSYVREVLQLSPEELAEFQEAFK